MGFFTIGGVGIFSIKNLITTRFYAEKNAAQRNFGNVTVSQQLTGWDYTTVTQKRADNDKHIVIPFLARDKAVTARGDLGSGYLQEESPSLSNRPDLAENPRDADYYWQNFDFLVSRRIWSTNSAHLASLYLQKPVSPGESSDEQIYLFRNLNNADELKRNLRDGGWIDIERIDVTRWESSQVAFPAFAPQK